MRLALYVCLKIIGDCLGSHNGSIHTTHTPLPCHFTIPLSGEFTKTNQSTPPCAIIFHGSMVYNFSNNTPVPSSLQLLFFLQKNMKFYIPLKELKDTVLYIHHQECFARLWVAVPSATKGFQYQCTICSRWLYSTLGGFNFILFWNFNRNQTEIIRYCQKITFYFLQNVWKCTVFSHLHLKYTKMLLWPKKKFFLKILTWVSNKRRILCWFQIRWCRLSEMPLTKL